MILMVIFTKKKNYNNNNVCGDSCVYPQDMSLVQKKQNLSTDHSLSWTYAILMNIILISL